MLAQHRPCFKYNRSQWQQYLPTLNLHISSIVATVHAGLLLIMAELLGTEMKPARAIQLLMSSSIRMTMPRCFYADTGRSLPSYLPLDPPTIIDSDRSFAADARVGVATSSLGGEESPYSTAHVRPG